MSGSQYQQAVFGELSFSRTVKTLHAILECLGRQPALVTDFSFLLVQTLGALAMVQVTELPSRDTRNEFVVPGFGLGQAPAPTTAGVWGMNQ